MSYIKPKRNIPCPKCITRSINFLHFTGNCSRTHLHTKQCELICLSYETRFKRSEKSLVVEFEKRFGPVPEQLKLPEVSK